MIITYLGHEAFKIQFGETVIALNPVSKESKLKGAKFGADIALISLNDPDFNGVENVTHGERAPFAITGPGEYEIKGIFIKGFKSPSHYGLSSQILRSKTSEGKESSKESRINTIYSIALEGMNICFLGAIDSKELSVEANEAIEDIDILFVPIGGSPSQVLPGKISEGNGVLSASAGYELAVKLEPRLIIPMHYDGAGDKNLKTFLKEAGEEGTKPIEKLTLKKKDLDGKEGEIVVLQEQ